MKKETGQYNQRTQTEQKRKHEKRTEAKRTQNKSKPRQKTR